jgi:predicted permease
MRLYRWLLRRSAPSLDREYGLAMEETFARRLADARRRGTLRVIYIWARELGGLVALHLNERQWKAGRMETALREIHHAIRRLRQAPAFTVAAVLTLALAIGANAAIFAVVERVVLRPLPYPDSDRLIEVSHGALKLNQPSGFGTTPGLYFHYLDRARAIESIAIYQSVDQTITGNGDSERIRVTRVTTSLVNVMAVQPVAGRWFLDDEGARGARSLAVLSHALWTRRFGRDERIIGSRITLEGEPVDVIGVMPPAFAFPDARVDVWRPLTLNRADGFGLWSYNGVARLREGVSYEDARSELNGLAADVGKAYPHDQMAVGNAETQLVFAGRTLKETILGGISKPLWVVLASVGLVLLVACANVANLFLVRSEARQRDIAVRRALGAGPSGIARYFFTESVLLATLGGVAGIGLAWAAIRLVVRFGPATLPRIAEIQLDGIVAIYTAALTLLTAIAFGAMPLTRGQHLNVMLQEGGRTNTVAPSRHRMRHGLMAAQVALALVLLVASGLMIRSFANIRAIDPGFDAASALAFNIGLPDRDYPNAETDVAAHHAIIERLAALPGASSVSASSCLPFDGGCWGNTIRIQDRPVPPGSMPPLSLFRVVASGYFHTMGMRLLKGRVIDRADIDRKTPVVVVNDTFARRIFPNDDPIGHRVAHNRPPDKSGVPQPPVWFEIIGVVADTPVRAVGPGELSLPQLYMPLSLARGPDSSTTDRLTPPAFAMSYVMRTATPPLALLPAARQAVATFDRNLAIAQPRTLQGILDRASAQMAFTMVLLAIAAAVALLLGVIGIYGVMSYIVSQRTSEIGVRLALGANPAGVAGAIVRQGGLVAVAGLTIGVAAALAGGHAIESLLYGVSPRDPIVFVATTLALLVVALVACWLPARRASKLSPVEALRC